MDKQRQGFLVLESGDIFQGLWQHPDEHLWKVGEVVFNTSHSGYEEIATDPSYFSQIMVMTAPHQGNYGSDTEVWESENLWVRGVVCLEMQNTKRENSWLHRLQKSQIPVLTEVDTRNLVLLLREKGSLWGCLLAEDFAEKAFEKALELIDKEKRCSPKKWANEVSTASAYDLSGMGSQSRVAVIDYGIKKNMLKELLKRCKALKVFNSRSSAEDIKSYNPDGIMLSNGPGDPAIMSEARDVVKQLVGWRPIFGICLGHHMLAMALGAKTYKLRFGHRASNHPIRDDLLKSVYVTAQNHGYAVDEKTLPSYVNVTHRNLNDQTVAGIACPEKKCFSVQFHPESHPGPHEAVALFDKFTEQMESALC